MIERYFAFGANLHPKTLERRRVSPLAAKPARLEGYRLVFDQPAFPVLDPVFASVRPARDHVWGVLYELEPEALHTLRSFEGEAYEEVGVSVSTGDANEVAARTFVTRGDHPERRPSARYLGLIVDGARHHGLPEAWVARLLEHPSLYVPVLHEAWGLVFRAVDHLHRRMVQPAQRRTD